MVEGYIGWASHVNKVILKETTLTFGADALQTDEISSGGKRVSLKGSYCPDKYSVVMDFEADENVTYVNAENEVVTLDKTEFQLFLEWYKYKHKYGTVAFEFPKITYSPQTGIKVIDDNSNNTLVEYYRITSSLECSKIGSRVQVRMTWESVYGGIINIPTTESVLKRDISKVTNNYIEVVFSEIGDTEPSKDEFTVFIDDTAVEFDGFYFDGSYTARLYLPLITLESGSHSIVVYYNSTNTNSYTYTI